MSNITLGKLRLQTRNQLPLQVLSLSVLPPELILASQCQSGGLTVQAEPGRTFVLRFLWPKPLRGSAVHTCTA